MIFLKSKFIKKSIKPLLFVPLFLFISFFIFVSNVDAAPLPIVDGAFVITDSGGGPLPITTYIVEGESRSSQALFYDDVIYFDLNNVTSFYTPNANTRFSICINLKPNDLGGRCNNAKTIGGKWGVSDGDWDATTKQFRFSPSENNLISSGEFRVSLNMPSIAPEIVDLDAFLVRPSSVNLIASNLCNGANDPRVRFDWTGGDGSTGFFLFRKTTAGSYTKISDLINKASTFSFDTTPNTTTNYSYKIVALNRIDKSPRTDEFIAGADTESNEVSVTTNSCAPTFVLDPNSASINIGQTQQFNGYYDADGPGGSAANTFVAGASIGSWNSSNNGIATVNGSGLAAGISAGASVISGTYSGITATASLTVGAIACNPSVNSPTAPSSPLPANSAINIPTGDVNLDWIDSVDADSACDNVIYDVYAGTSNPPPFVSSGVPSSQFNFNASLNSTTYYWKIVAKDTGSNQTAGPVWSFTTDAAPPLPDFNLTVTPSLTIANPNQAKVYTIKANFVNGFNGPVALSVSNVTPASKKNNLARVFTKNGTDFFPTIDLTFSGDQAYLAVKDDQEADRGTDFNIIIRGKNGSLEHEYSRAFHINQKPVARFKAVTPTIGPAPLSVSFRDGDVNGASYDPDSLNPLIYVADLDTDGTIDKCYIPLIYVPSIGDCNSVWPGSNSLDPVNNDWTFIYNHTIANYAVIDLDLFNGFATLSEPASIGISSIGVNNNPVANAGPDQSVNENTLVTLDGTASSDPDGDPITYSWAQIAGTAVVLGSSTSANPTFTSPLVGLGGEVLTFRLTVNDGQGGMVTDDINVTVNDVLPIPFLRIVPSATILRINQSFQFQALYDPDGSGPQSEIDVTNDPGTVWSSSSSTVATVTSGLITGNGLVTAADRGTTIISAVYNSFNSTSNANVRVIRFKWEER